MGSGALKKSAPKRVKIEVKKNEIPSKTDLLLVLQKLGVPGSQVKSACEHAWKETDVKNKGFVGREEMGTCLLKVYDQVKLIQPDLRQPTQEERRRGVEDALAQLDSNGDGKLEKSEFDRFVLLMLIMIKTLYDDGNS